MRNIICLCLITTISYTYSQNQEFSVWQAELDTYLSETGAPSPHPKGKDAYDAAVKSHSLTDMYYEGYSFIYGLTRAWQATGDFSYLDKALHMVEEDIKGAVYLEDFYTTGDGENAVTKKPWAFNGNITLPNYYLETYNYTFPSSTSFNYYFPDVRDYNANATDDKYSFNYVAARDARAIHDLQPLGENIYYRYVADMLRVMNHNSSILAFPSNNGQTYQERFNFILTYLEKHIYEKWVEFESTDRHWEYYVGRINTHMSAHLPSIAVSLYSITNNEKYIDFVEEFLYDFGSNPKSANVPSGVGLLDQLENIDGNILWAREWGEKTSTGGEQDVTHSGSEYHFFLQCFEEGIGTNPPSGEIPIDENLINGLLNTFKNLTLPDGADMCSKTNLHENIDGTGSTSFFWGPVQGQFAYAQYSSDMLCYAEYNSRGSIQKVGDIGNILYAKRSLGVEGLSAPVYPTLGINGGNAPFNNAPNVILPEEGPININIGDDYKELGAIWTDIQDGQGIIEVPSSGNVDTSTPGKYTLIYTYTDFGGLQDNATLVVNVNTLGNDCPIISLNGSASISLGLNDEYTELGATWSDTEDGSGNASIDGDTIDTAVTGNYTVIYSYRDTGGCTIIKNRNVIVYDKSEEILATSMSWDEPTNPLEVSLNKIVNLSFTVLPENRTVQYSSVQVDVPDSIAYVDPNGNVYTNGVGEFNVTISTYDGSNLSITKRIVVIDENSSESPIVGNTPNINVSNASAKEGELLTFVTTLNEANSEEIIINLSSEQNSATDNDFLLTETQLIFKPGETEKSITVQALPDTQLEGEETFTIKLEVLDINSNEISEIIEATGKITDIITESNNVSLKIFPNPVNSLETITILGTEVNESYVLSIFNIGGQLIESNLITVGSENIEYNLPSLSPGIYVVIMSSGNKEYQSKLIVK